MKRHIKIVLKAMLWIFSRAIILYAVVCFFTYLIVDHNRVDFGVKVRVIEKAMPKDFTPIIEHIQTGSGFSEKEINKFTQFYQVVLKYFPDQADAWHMLGLIYAYQDQFSKAESVWLKSKTIKPKYFWVNYNLARYYQQMQKWPEVLLQTEEALLAEFSHTFAEINQSKIIYRSLILADPTYIRYAKFRFDQAYFDMHMLKMRALLHLAEYTIAREYLTDLLNKKVLDKELATQIKTTLESYIDDNFLDKETLQRLERMLDQSIRLNNIHETFLPF